MLDLWIKSFFFHLTAKETGQALGPSTVFMTVLAMSVRALLSE